MAAPVVFSNEGLSLLEPYLDERINFYKGDEELFRNEQVLMNICDSLKDGYKVKGKDCNNIFKANIAEVYGVSINDIPSNFLNKLHPLEDAVEENQSLGGKPELISWLTVEYRIKTAKGKNVTPVKTNHLPDYVSDLIQETGYYPLNIQPSGKLKYICFSKFDPGTRTTVDDGLEYFGPSEDTPIIFSDNLMNKLGVPKTKITLERIDDGGIIVPPTYKITIVSNGSTISETIDMGSPFPESSTFLGNTEKDKRITEICALGKNVSASNKKIIKDLIVSKLLGDKLQVIGTLLYILCKYGSSKEVIGEYDKVCLFTVDKVVATLCRILGISCCLQTLEGEDEDEESVEQKNSKGGVLKVFRVKYFPTFVDARTLYTSSLDIELNAALKNNLEVRNNIARVIAGEVFIVGSSEIIVNEKIKSFLQIIFNHIDQADAWLQGTCDILKGVGGDMDENRKVFKLLSSTFTAKMLITPGPRQGLKALQSAARVFATISPAESIYPFPPQLNADPISDYVDKPRSTFGARLLKLQDPGDDLYAKHYSKKRASRGGSSKKLIGGEEKEGEEKGITELFLEKAREALDIIGEEFEKIIPNIEEYSVREMTFKEDLKENPFSPAKVLTKEMTPRKFGMPVKQGGGFFINRSKIYMAIKRKIEEFEEVTRGAFTLTFLKSHPEEYIVTSFLDFKRSLHQNDEFDILYLLYSYLTYIGETPLNSEIIEVLLLELLKNPDMTLSEFKVIYDRQYESTSFSSLLNAASSLEEGEGGEEERGEGREEEEGEVPVGVKRKLYGGFFRKTRKLRKGEKKLKGILKTRGKKKVHKDKGTRRNRNRTSKKCHILL
jgi:hypothetical protein